MNDLEHEIRDALRRHEDDAPTFDASDARRAVDRTRQRQVLNVAGVGICTLVFVIGLVAGLNALGRDRFPTALDSPTVLDRPCPSPTSVATPRPDDAKVRDYWPDTNRNPPGLYSWDGHGDMYHLEGFMHNGYSHRPGEVSIFIGGDPEQLIPHRGQCAIVAGYEGTYRRFIGKRSPSLHQSSLDWDDSSEEWMVDIQGTTVTITLAADPRTPEAQVADAHEIIDSIYVDPQDNDLGFRLIFTVPTNDWDSG